MPIEYPKAGGGTGECDSRHYAVMMALKYRIVQLQLPHFPNDQIEVLKQPANRGILRTITDGRYGDDGSAAMVISPIGERMLKRKNAARDIEYSSRITVFEASNLDNRTGLDRRLGWRDSITDEFDDYPFGEVVGGQRVTITPGSLNPFPAWLKGFDVDTFVVNATLCVSRPWNP